MLHGSFDLPVLFDLGATFAFALSGALAAIKRGYDIVGVLALALVASFSS
ncbi:MAG: hypothetical protein JWQ83_581 [Lacunisphaera sp.]|nr:hypothetical protein [Lacunisphaera sp.]